MKVPVQKELLMDQALYDVELDLVPVIGMQPTAFISVADVRRFISKRKSATGARSSRMSKKSQLDAPSIAACLIAPLEIEELDDDVVIMEAPTIQVELLVHDMSVLEKDYQAFGDLHRAWSNKVTMAETKKNAALGCLQIMTNREKEVVEREKK
ncbi:hypothetical protein COCNU_scaffold000099G000040 [Cocos nucifera]|nr:hypothetical protein [Cocos nucifera]